MNFSKQRLRQFYKSSRREFSAQFTDVQRRSHRENILSVLPRASSLASGEPFHFGTYYPKGDEASPLAVVEASRSWISWAFPRINDEADSDWGNPLSHMEYYQTDSQTNWKVNRFGICEPAPELSKKVQVGELIGMLVPGLAFDREGHRLGYGAGYFDRTLSQFFGLKIGIGYSVQLSEELLPREPHDIPMNYVVTEKEIIRVTERT